MGLFTKAKEKVDRVATPEKSEKPLSWDDDLSEAALENAKAGGRKRKTPVSSTEGEPESGQTQLAALQSDVEKLLTPENLALLAKLPGAAMYAQSGFKHWEVSDKEAMQIAVPGSVLAKYYGNVDPGKLAIAFLLINSAIVYAPRTMEHFRLKAEQRKHTASPDGRKPELVK